MKVDLEKAKVWSIAPSMSISSDSLFNTLAMEKPKPATYVLSSIKAEASYFADSTGIL